MRPSFQICAGALAVLALSTFGVAAAAAPAAQGPAVVELFTSQGCSSCPPADALLNKLAEMPGVLTLSFSVDYWDYLGWHDTLGSAANSERQRDYAQARGDGRVYTPQAVVDGLLHVNGADERMVLDAIDAARARLRDVRVPVQARAEGDTLVIDIGNAQEGSHSRDATVWLAIAKEKETVPISRGENSGRTITYRHPVREISPVGMWKGEAMSLHLPLKDLKMMGGDCLFALLQAGSGGPILGAAYYEQD
jgi:hypothetical protein